MYFLIFEGLAVVLTVFTSWVTYTHTYTAQ